MRYYRIDIRDPKTGKLVQPTYFKQIGLPSSYTSYVNGKSLPNALGMQLDIPVSTYANPRQGAYCRIWGISLAEISQSNDLNGLDIKIYAGMQKGLPLAKPKQAGLIMQGTIFQAFGNWVGTDQTLDMTLLPPMGATATPVNLILDWQAGQPLATSLRQSLSVAFPSYTVKVAISDQLVRSDDQKGFYTGLNEFAKVVLKLTQESQFQGIKPLSGGKYPGVEIVIRGTTIIAYDGTVEYGAASYQNPTKVQFEDLVGQPTWISPTSLNFKCVMRADIQVGDYIEMPTRLSSPFVVTTPASAFPNTPARNKSVFQGKFAVIDVHHFGNFRQPDAASWCTSFDAVSLAV